MLLMREEQLVAIRRETVAALVRALARKFRDDHDLTRGLSDGEVLERVRGGVARAEQIGVTRKSAFEFLARKAVELGPAFEENPHINSILEDATRTPDARVRRLMLGVKKDE
jgi:hypothetical protein